MFEHSRTTTALAAFPTRTPNVVAVSAEEWQRKTERKGTLAQFLLDSPLLDTNILSEVTKPAPHAGALTWLDTLDEDRTFVNVISIAEIHAAWFFWMKAGSVTL